MVRDRREAMTLGRTSLLLSALGAPVIFYLLARGAAPGPEMAWQAALSVTVVVLIANGAEWLVDSAARIAQAMGVSHLVIGLTVVAFGTSAPEMAASLVAGFQGNGDITIANVVGSNIFNICFILGGVSLVLRQGLAIDEKLLRRDAPTLFVGTLLLFLFVGALPGHDPAVERGDASFWPQLLDLRLEAMEGLVLVALLATYLFVLYRSRNAGGEALDEEHRSTIESFGPASWRDGPMFLLGLGLVVGGCHVLVGHAEVIDGVVKGHGALWFARVWDVPDYVIGVTIIAAGTSAPEFVVSLVAATRGAFGISAGNLIGSDIFNMFGVVGLSGLVLQPPLASPVTLSPSVVPGLAALSVVLLVTIAFMRSDLRISRLEGLWLVLIGAARWITDFVFRGAL
jgi:cation:H+ antiporter